MTNTQNSRIAINDGTVIASDLTFEDADRRARAHAEFTGEPTAVYEGAFPQHVWHRRDDTGEMYTLVEDWRAV